MWKKITLACACGAALLAATPALSGTLQINPVLVEISPDRRTATVTVRNADPSPVTIRAYPLAWSQSNNEDEFGETAAIIVSPPVATIDPGATQSIRVGLRRADATPTPYRLIVEEVPEAAPDGGIKVALRLNLPLYSMMAAGEASDLVWSAHRSRTGWIIEAENRGTGYVRADAALATRSTGLAFADGTSFGTVLPGARRRWVMTQEPEVADPAALARIQGAARDANPAGGE